MGSLTRLLSLGTVALGAAATLAQAATMYTITSLGTLPGHLGSRPDAINNAGQVTGVSFGNSGSLPFLWSAGTMTAIPGVTGGWSEGINSSGHVVVVDNTGSTYVSYVWNGTSLVQVGGSGAALVAKGINDSGHVVGSFDSVPGAFLWTGSGAATALPGIAGAADPSREAWAINSTGQIAGATALPAGAGRPPATWDAATLTATSLGFGTPTPGAGSAGQATAINDAGQMAGITPVAGGSRAFFYSGGTMTTIPTFGGINGWGYGINASGVVVGMSALSSGATHAFSYSTGDGLIDLNTVLLNGAGWLLTEAYDVNDSGQIVGYGTFGGQGVAFLLTPDSGGGSEVPEPATWAMAALALAGMGAARARYRR